MNRSRSKTRKGSVVAVVDRPKRATRNQCPSYADVVSERNPKKMRVASPPSQSSSQASQQGRSSSQPQPRRKSMTESRRQVMNHYIQSARDDPKKHGKVGSIQWMNKVLKVVNHSAGEEKDRVSNLDMIRWLEKHFDIKVEDITRSMHTRMQTRSRSKESVGSDVIEVRDDEGSSRDESSDEESITIAEAAVEKTEVGRKRKAKATTSQAALENAPEPVTPVKGGAKSAPEAIGNPQEAVENALEVGNSPGEEVKTPESAARDHVASSSVEFTATTTQGAATTTQGAATSVEALAANDQPATATAKDAVAALVPEVVNLDDDDNADGSNGSGLEDDKVPHQSTSVSRAKWVFPSSESNAGLSNGSGTHEAGEPVRPVVTVHRPESPLEYEAGTEQTLADPVIGIRQQVVVSPDVQKLQMQMVALRLQIEILQQNKRYSVEQIEVLSAQAKAMDAMIKLLTTI